VALVELTATLQYIDPLFSILLFGPFCLMSTFKNVCRDVTQFKIKRAKKRRQPPYETTLEKYLSVFIKKKHKKNNFILKNLIL